MLNLMQELWIAVWAARGNVACIQCAIIKAEDAKLISPDRRHALVDAVLLPKCLFELVPIGLDSVRSRVASREVIAVTRVGPHFTTRKPIVLKVDEDVGRVHS